MDPSTTRAEIYLGWPTCREQSKIPPDVNRILYVKNLNFKTRGEVCSVAAVAFLLASVLTSLASCFCRIVSLVTGNFEETSKLDTEKSCCHATVYELFGRYGGIRQIRLGNGQKTRGTAYVVYEDIFDVSTHSVLVMDLLTVCLCIHRQKTLSTT